MKGVWSSHTEAALLILGLGSILTRQYLRAAKAWQVHGKGRAGANLSPLVGQPQRFPPQENLSDLSNYSHSRAGPTVDKTVSFP